MLHPPILHKHEGESVVRWYKNYLLIVLQIENKDSGEYTLRIAKSIPSDGAAYRVVLSNERGEVQSSALAHVKGELFVIYRGNY